MYPTSLEERVRLLTQRLAGRVLGRSRISPNSLTSMGLLLTLGVTYGLATGHLAWGGLLLLFTSAFDMLVGALARATERTSAFGAFFDSTVDRYAEALVLLGLLLYFEQQPDAQWATVLVHAGIVGSLMVSYTRARTEALGFTCTLGLCARPERVLLLSAGLIIGWPVFAAATLAILTNVTAVQRVHHVWQQERQRYPNEKRAGLPQSRPVRSHEQGAVRHTRSVAAADTAMDMRP